MYKYFFSCEIVDDNIHVDKWPQIIINQCFSVFTRNKKKKKEYLSFPQQFLPTFATVFYSSIFSILWTIMRYSFEGKVEKNDNPITSMDSVRKWEIKLVYMTARMQKSVHRETRGFELICLMRRLTWLNPPPLSLPKTFPSPNQRSLQLRISTGW